MMNLGVDRLLFMRADESAARRTWAARPDKPNTLRYFLVRPTFGIFIPKAMSSRSILGCWDLASHCRARTASTADFTERFSAFAPAYHLPASPPKTRSGEFPSKRLRLPTIAVATLAATQARPGDTLSAVTPRLAMSGGIGLPIAKLAAKRAAAAPPMTPFPPWPASQMKLSAS